MKVVEIPFGAVGLDCLTPIIPANARAMAACALPGTRTGVTFVERYLENLTPDELEGLFAADLGVAVVGEGRGEGWSAASGAADAERELARARALELPANSSPRLSIGCDLEAMVKCSPGEAFAYGAAWGRAVASAGYGPELYVGDAVPLTPRQLYLLPFVGYWRSLSNVQQVAVADFNKLQAFPTQTLNLPSGSFAVDCNFVTRDKKMRLPSMVVGR